MDIRVFITGHKIRSSILGALFPVLLVSCSNILINIFKYLWTVLLRFQSLDMFQLLKYN